MGGRQQQLGASIRWGAYKRWVPGQPGYLENSDTSCKNVTSRGTVVKLQEGSNPEVCVMPSQLDRRRGNSRRLTLYLLVFGREVWLAV